MINRLMIMLLLAALSSAGWAGTLQNKVSWDDLGAEEQQLLQPFAEKWDSLPPGQQLRLMKGASRWKELTPEQRKLLNQRFKAWKELDTEITSTIRAVPEFDQGRTEAGAGSLPMV